MDKFVKWVFNRHDVYCNQKYDKNLPYSFHLNCVYNQGKKFFHYFSSASYKSSIQGSELENIKAALYGHDLLEDARESYNGLIDNIQRFNFSKKSAIIVADIIYCVTDEKGKDRPGRKNDRYYKELSENKLAVFVKLSDIAANTLYSKLTGNTMYEKYKKEFPKFKEKVYIEEYEDFFNYVENL